MNPAKTIQSRKVLTEIILKLSNLEDIAFQGAIDGAMGALDLRISTELFGCDAHDMFYDKLNSMGANERTVLSIVQDFTEPYCNYTSAMAAGKAQAAYESAKEKFSGLAQ